MPEGGQIRSFIDVEVADKQVASWEKPPPQKSPLVSLSAKVLASVLVVSQNLKVILISGYASAKYHTAIQETSDFFLPKPSKMPDLARALRL
jgi:hypothetical protein